MKLSENLISRVIQIIFVAALLVAWVAATKSGAVHLLLLPDPERVWAAMQRLATTGRLWSEAQVTMMEVAYAYLFAVIPGLGIGFLVSRSPRAVKFCEPIFSGIFTVPLTLFLPLFIFFFGIGPSAKIAFGGVYAFFPVVITAIAAFVGVERLHIAAGRSMGATNWQMFRRVYLPSAMPGILTGLRIAAIVCIASVLGAETVSALRGLGRSIAYASELMDSVQMFAWLLYVVIMAIVINLMLTAAEARAHRRY
jgi:NitT/TauT family transport system permease protein